MKAISKELGLLEAVSVGIGGMIGGGIFSAIGVVVGVSGETSFLSLILNSVIASLTGYSYAKLGVKYKSRGGSYTFVRNAFKNSFTSIFAGFTLIAAYISCISLYAYAFGAYFSHLFNFNSFWTEVAKHAASTAAISAFIALNSLSVRGTGVTEDLIVIGKVAILMIFMSLGMMSARYLPVKVNSLSNLPLAILGAGLIFIAFEGFEQIANTAEDLNEADKNIPKATYASILIVSLIYLGTLIALLGNLTPLEIIAHAEYALAAASKNFLGRSGFTLMTLGALLSTGSAINASLFSVSRIAQSMSKDGYLPGFLSSMRGKRRNIPWASILAVGIISVIFSNVSSIVDVVSVSSAMFMIVFILVNCSGIRKADEVGIKRWIPYASLSLITLLLTVMSLHLYTSKFSSFMTLISVMLTIVLFSLILRLDYSRKVKKFESKP